MISVPERQTKTRQKRLIDGAKWQGKLHDLYWFVNAYIPGRYYDDRRAKVQPAMFPKLFVPVIRMTPDEVESRHYADVLSEIFSFVNRGRGFDFAVEITDIHELQSGNWQWYEWGSVQWDCVCGVCGGVFADTSPQLDICEECRREVSCGSATLCDGDVSG